MRVAMIGQYPLDAGRILGGVEAVMVPLLHGLASLPDLDLHVVTCQGPEKDRLTSTPEGVPLYVRRRRHLGRVTFYARDVASIHHALKAIAPDIVHAHGVGIYAISALGYPCAHVVTAHGIFYREAQFAPDFPSRVRGSFDSFYEKYSVGRVRNLIAINPYVQQELAQIGGFRGNLYAIENPVDDLFFAANGAADESTILYAGRVLPRKGLLYLLWALALVHKAMPGVKLRVAGETDTDPEYVAACQQFIAEHGLEKAVAFLGPLTVTEMAMEYSRSALLALPSGQETAPVVVAEAMAAGRPVVATRRCGMPYMVEHERSGLLVDYDDAPGLADALLRVLRDDSLRVRMGQRGRELARARFRADVVAQQTWEVYSRVLNEASPSRRPRQ